MKLWIECVEAHRKYDGKKIVNKKLNKSKTFCIDIARWANRMQVLSQIEWIKSLDSAHAEKTVLELHKK